MKIYLDIVGCRLNQAEIEKYALQFRGAGHVLVASPAEADLVVVNTCTVTAEAASDSRQKIRQAAKAGKARIFATGCLATCEAESLMELDGVSGVIPNCRKDKLVNEVLQVDESSLSKVARVPLPGVRARTRAFIKSQDGCDNFCTYCITRLARGNSASTPAETIVADIQAAMDGGVKEAVLTGVQLGSWGKDFTPPQRLQHLVRYILEMTLIPRLRLSSVEPWELEDEFFDLWRNERMCAQLHLPLQSGCAQTLKRMGRKNTPEMYWEYLEKVRQMKPDIAITTDILVGFPGETDEEFAASLDFIRRSEFAGGHVFHFSPRPGTSAAKMAGQVNPKVAKLRGHLVHEALAESSVRYQQRFIGKTLSVLWESACSLQPDGWHVEGLSSNYLRITAVTDKLLSGSITPVKVTRLTPNGLSGKLIN
ncbi:MAG TPA: MiaB/RimO family radical SAM methylthiotransferase [Longilinea sp.]|nr:MiaB/RimO family radical SAM methylthiotransferase [Longilinea sp.]